MESITYKQILDSEGHLLGLELCQGQQSIKISLAGKGTHKNGYRWIEIKEVVDRLSKRARKDAEDQLGYGIAVTETENGYRATDA